MTTTLLIATFPPFPSLTLTLPSDTPCSEIPSHLPDRLPSFEQADLSLSRPSGSLVLDSTPIGSLCSRCGPSGTDDVDILAGNLVSLRLTPRVRGGKGGFGSQLRAAGGRMSSQKTSNNDSCRDLNGRRLSTIKEAKALAAYLESEPERKKAQQEAQRAKLEKLERKLGITPGAIGKDKDEGSSSGVKRRFDDTEYLEQSRDIVDNVKSAVSAGMLKKKKKAKTSPPREDPSETDGAKATTKSEEVKPTDTENTLIQKEAEIVGQILESPATAPVAAVAAASLAAVGA